MNEKQPQFNWHFALQWIVSCSIGTAVFGVIAYSSMWPMAEAVSANNEMLKVLVAGALLGAWVTLGGTLGPGLLLRRKGISARRWIGYSMAAAVITMGSGVSVISSQNYFMEEAIVSALFLGLAFGVPIGLVQWYLLKQQGISAAFWPLITVVGYLLAFGIVVFFSREGREWVILGWMGLSLGGITSLGMLWILRREVAVAM